MTGPSTEDLLVVEGLDKSFTLHLHGGVRLPVVSKVAFTVARGECVVLGGPSGVGKSSILKIVFGNYRPDAGRILLADGDRFLGGRAGANPQAVISARRRIMGYVSQFLRVIPRVPTIDIVAAAAREAGTRGSSRACARRFAAGPSQFVRAAVAAAAGDVFRRRTATRQYRAGFRRRACAAYPRRADRLSGRRKSRRGRRIDR